MDALAGFNDDVCARAIAFLASQSDGPPIDPSLRVTVHFHPDRSAGDGLVIDALVREGVYRCQFETATSNGGLTAHPGGDRWLWESRIFGGAYDQAPAEVRPKYGALNHRRASIGGSPRFGSAHLRLAPATLARTTLCYPDSVYLPRHFGVASSMRLDLPDTHPLSDPLDDYIEAHVHGVLNVATDVEAVVIDPSHRGTRVEDAARRLACNVEWHAGFRVEPEAIANCNEYSGPEVASLAVRLANGCPLTPRVLGEAFRAGIHDSQALKRVWHCIARFGAPPGDLRGPKSLPQGLVPTPS